MKRTIRTIGEERHYYRSLNHVERRRYWQRVNEPRRTPNLRYIARRRSSLLRAFNEVYSTPFQNFVYVNRPFLSLGES